MPLDICNSAIARRFVLLSAARSGTSALMSALRHHPEIFAHGEVFSSFEKLAAGNGKQLRLEFADRFGVPDPRTAPVAFLDRLVNFTPGPPVVGFKMWFDQSPKGCAALMDDAWVSKIVLNRRNRLASYSSRQLASMTGKWGKLRGKGDRAPSEPALIPQFDPDHFRAYAARIDRFQHAYRTRSRGDVLHLTYEDVDQVGLRRTLDFLGVDPDGTDFRLAKQNSRDILARYAPDVAPIVERTCRDMGHPEWLTE